LRIGAGSLLTTVGPASGGSARVLDHVHDLDLIAAFEVLLAGTPQIFDRPLAPGR
jgi:hypothetical protein